MEKWILSAALMASMVCLSGCETSDGSPETYWNGGETTTAAAATNAEGEPVAAAPTASAGSVPSDLSGVVFLHANVAGWPVTSSLNGVSVSGGNINLPYDKANVWPGVNHSGANVNANPWVIVFVDGVWYAATFEWFRVGQTSKPVSTVSGSHIKKAPLSNFVPVSGETYGFMVSGLARDSTRNVEERTNVRMYRWP